MHRELWTTVQIFLKKNKTCTQMNVVTSNYWVKVPIEKILKSKEIEKINSYNTTTFFFTATTEQNNTKNKKINKSANFISFFYCTAHKGSCVVWFFFLDFVQPHSLDGTLIIAYIAGRSRLRLARKEGF